MPIRGVVFDMDGTLVSQELDFEAIRRDIGVPAGTPLLEALAAMDPLRRQQAEAILETHERLAAERAELLDGVREFLDWIDRRGLKRAILTRNTRWAAGTIMSRIGLVFDPILAREDGPPKPSPDGIHTICNVWGICTTEVLMIGDYIYDVEAGRAAGARTALVTHGREWPFAHLADVTFPNFRELPSCWEKWFDD